MDLIFKMIKFDMKNFGRQQLNNHKHLLYNQIFILLAIIIIIVNICLVFVNMNISHVLHVNMQVYQS